MLHLAVEEAVARTPFWPGLEPSLPQLLLGDWDCPLSFTAPVSWLSWPRIQTAWGAAGQRQRGQCGSSQIPSLGADKGQWQSRRQRTVRLWEDCDPQAKGRLCSSMHRHHLETLLP
jgi:hypothetical protein